MFCVRFNSDLSPQLWWLMQLRLLWVAYATLPSGEDGGSKRKEAPNEGPRRQAWRRLDALRARGAKPLSCVRGIAAIRKRKGSQPKGRDTQRLCSREPDPKGRAITI